MSAGISERTVAGLMAYCDWLKEKGYQGASATDSWKSAVKKVFETVEPESFEAIEVDKVDLDEQIERFQTLAGSKYRAETITVYKRRIQNAIEAQAYYIEHRKPPSFKRGTPRPAEALSPDKKKPKATRRLKAVEQQSTDDMWDFEYPLSSGVMVEMRLPKRMSKADVDRLSAVLRTLQTEEQAQLPASTGESIAA